jgi:hypothetical protein
MSVEIGHGKLRASDKSGFGEVKVLLLEEDRPTLTGVKATLESLGVGVISARSTARALDLCSAPHLRFGVLVLGPSLLDSGLGSLLERVLPLQGGIRVLVLTQGNSGPSKGSTMTPLAICWALECSGCEYSLLDDPWTGARLQGCLQELLARACRAVASGDGVQGVEDGRPPWGTRRPSCTRIRGKL